MGLIKAAVDAFGGTLADQWKDFHTVPQGIAGTAAFFGAARRGINAGRGANLSASDDVISNGSKFVVPEGYGLILMQDGEITGLSVEPGAFEWNSEQQDSQSLFAGDGAINSIITTSWERFAFGGRPQSQQRAFFVSLKELPNNRFATPSEIYWDDGYLNTQVGALTRGTYSLQIVDPILFVRNFLPARYLEPGAVFDFTDLYNDAAIQLFNEVLGSLSAAFSGYVNEPGKSNRISRIQQDSVGFASSLAATVERDYGWRTQRGLALVRSAIVTIEYDEASRELLKTVQRADALVGVRGNSNLQASVAQGLQLAGESDGAAGMFGVAMAAGSMGISGIQHSANVTSSAPAPSEGAAEPEDMMATLTKFKQMLDAGLITQDDYDAAKAKFLGL